ncbi:MAG: hypothetical protein HZA08_02390 [Nitrospirae bacterium]|nr:hypothetical protein [Nitrospirota bacterium]
MKHGQKVVVLIFFLFSLQFLILSKSAWSSDSDIRLVHSDRKEVTIELTIPEYRIVQKKVGETIYDEVVLGEYGYTKEEGKPELPLRGTLIGVPEEGTVTIKSAGSDYKTIHLDHDISPYLLRIKRTSPHVIDLETYQADVFYPGQLATEGFTGYMRDQHVKQIIFYPVQYNPVKREVRIYNRIRVELSFEKPIEGNAKTLSRKVKKGSQPAAAGAYEKLLKDSLLNYDSLQR